MPTNKKIFIEARELITFAPNTSKNDNLIFVFLDYDDVEIQIEISAYEFLQYINTNTILEIKEHLSNYVLNK